MKQHEEHSKPMPAITTRESQMREVCKNMRNIEIKHMHFISTRERLMRDVCKNIMNIANNYIQLTCSR